MADGDSNKLLVVDVRRLTKRYLTAVLERATANAVIDGIVVILYRAVRVPVTADASISQSVAVTDS
jgi:hypothetical protein